MVAARPGNPAFNKCKPFQAVLVATLSSSRASLLAPSPLRTKVTQPCLIAHEMEHHQASYSPEHTCTFGLFKVC